MGAIICSSEKKSPLGGSTHSLGSKDQAIAQSSTSYSPVAESDLEKAYLRHHKERKCSRFKKHPIRRTTFRQNDDDKPMNFQRSSTANSSEPSQGTVEIYSSKMHIPHTKSIWHRQRDGTARLQHVLDCPAQRTCSKQFPVQDCQAQRTCSKQFPVKDCQAQRTCSKQFPVKDCQAQRTCSKQFPVKDCQAQRTCSKQFPVQDCQAQRTCSKQFPNVIGRMNFRKNTRRNEIPVCPYEEDCFERENYADPPLLQITERCGLCDFFAVGNHHRWNELDDDARVFKELSCRLIYLLNSYVREEKEKYRILLKKEENGEQGIYVYKGAQCYKIQVANPHEQGEVSEGAANSNSDKGLPESMALRRMNPRGGQLLRSRAQEGDSVDQSENSHPPVDTMEACNKAAERLRELANHLQHGEVPISVLQKALQYAACVLDTVCVDGTNRKTVEEEDDLSEFHPNAVPTEVREWLASTFTKKTTTQQRRSEDKPRFRSVANAIRAGIMVDRLYRRMSSTASFYIPTHINVYLRNLDNWSFDVFTLNETANGQGLRYLAYELLNRYGLTHKYKISSSTIENFMSQVLQGYVRHRNPYHNDLHAADVTQTVHYMLCQQGLANWLSDLEIFAALVAAIIHDYEHTGTTNNFHVMSRSETAMLYNDRAVLENHHVSTAFRLMREEDCNILSHLSKEEYKEFRNLVIDMVLATDMSSHFQQIKSIKSLISHPEYSIDKSKALSLVLHCCDISHPSKNWALHRKWTMLLMEEFFLQGDKEQSLGLPYSPLCDRNTTLIAESQIGFIDFIVSPSLEVCGDLLEEVERRLQGASNAAGSESISEETQSDSNNKASALRRKSQSLSGTPTEGARKDSADGSTASSEPTNSAPTSPKAGAALKSRVKRPWLPHLDENKIKWKERTHKDAELRAQLSVVRDDASNSKKPENDLSQKVII